MSDERVERRLAAVLAADVAGYSRLMGLDEEGTLGRLKAIRKALIDPAIASHRGRVVKTTGDGMLVEFASAVDAARCGAEVQRGMFEQNGSLSQEQRIEFRIASTSVMSFLTTTIFSAMELTSLLGSKESRNPEAFVSPTTRIGTFVARSISFLMIWDRRL